MRIVLRIGLIVLAAALVAGAATALGAGSQSAGRGRPERARQVASAAPQDGAAPAASASGARPGGRGGEGGFGLGEVVKNLAISAALIALFSPVMGWVDRWRFRRPRREPAPPAG